LAHPYKVGFLFDRENSWINSHLPYDSWLPKFKNEYNFKELWSAETATDFDILFILGYTKILPTSVLSKNRLNLVIHESALPEGRGFSPVQWQVLEGATDVPVCLIEATEKVDEGDILCSTTIRLVGHELFDEIRCAQANATKELIINFLEAFPDISRRPQVGQATYYRRRNRDDDRLDVEISIMSQFNKLRVADNQNYPLYFEAHGYCYELCIRKVNTDE
jgi:methionyl-tRNA formyltransferase